MKRSMLIVLAFLITVPLFVYGHQVAGFGKETPCPDTYEGKHGYANLAVYAVYDGIGHKIAVPDDLGRLEIPTSKQGKSFCYEALHTHDTSGKIHIQISGKNDVTLGTFLFNWRPELLGAKILVDGKTVKDPIILKVKPRMDIKIYMRSRAFYSI